MSMIRIWYIERRRVNAFIRRSEGALALISPGEAGLVWIMLYHARERYVSNICEARQKANAHYNGNVPYSSR